MRSKYSFLRISLLHGTLASLVRVKSFCAQFAGFPQSFFSP